MGAKNNNFTRNREKIIELHKNGLNNLQISEEIGVNHSTICCYIRDLGLTPNKTVKSKNCVNGCMDENGKPTPKYGGSKYCNTCYYARRKKEREKKAKRINVRKANVKSKDKYFNFYQDCKKNIMYLGILG